MRSTRQGHSWSVRLGLVAVLSCLVTGCTLPGSASSAGIVRRAWHTSTLLGDGRILVAGGADGGALDAAELFDPATGRWAATASLGDAREEHTATRLADGRVLVIGGWRGGWFRGGGGLDTAERYDPATGRWEGAGRMGVRRMDHTATLLPDGRVLVTGGKPGIDAGDYATAGAEIYDSSTDRWVPAAPMAHARQGHTATLLPDGRVLVVGGSGAGLDTDTHTAEAYRPSADRWEPVAPPLHGHINTSAALLADGTVLIVDNVAGSERYDPAANRWRPVPPPVLPISWVAIAPLPDGRVLAVSEATVAAYDPATDGWQHLGTLVTPRIQPTTTALPNGQVVLIGGTSKGPPAEIITPSSMAGRIVQSR